ncbi:hypothetical protein Mapa_014264 [Marchantia paleacea]|nr:hypothetical protein Mapa_014264 [Marchantia paleacea]
MSDKYLLGRPKSCPRENCSSACIRSGAADETRRGAWRANFTRQIRHRAHRLYSRRPVRIPNKRENQWLG